MEQIIEYVDLRRFILANEMVIQYKGSLQIQMFTSLNNRNACYFFQLLQPDVLLNHNPAASQTIGTATVALFLSLAYLVGYTLLDGPHFLATPVSRTH